MKHTDGKIMSKASLKKESGAQTKCDRPMGIHREGPLGFQCLSHIIPQNSPHLHETMQTNTEPPKGTKTVQCLLG